MSRLAVLTSVLVLNVVVSIFAAAQDPAPVRWINPLCTPLECTKNGPFSQADDGTLMAVDKNVLVTSADAGKTWTPISEPMRAGYGLQLRRAYVSAIADEEWGHRHFLLGFRDAELELERREGRTNPECRLEMWASAARTAARRGATSSRSSTGTMRTSSGFIQTSTGEIVATVEHLIPDLKRWVSCSFVSADDGKTWKRSNWIDLGGHGHHDGAVEPTVAELSDGRLMMLIRTGLDQFWRAYSDDKGRNWRVIEPSGINASSAPGWVLRLKSGRLAFVWNQVKAEGAEKAPKPESGGQASEIPASWHREEFRSRFRTTTGRRGQSRL